MPLAVRRGNRRGQGKSFPTPAVPAELVVTGDVIYYNYNCLLLSIIPVGSEDIPPATFFELGYDIDPDYQFPNSAGEDTLDFLFDQNGPASQARLCIEFDNGPLAAEETVLISPFNRAFRGPQGEYFAAINYALTGV